MLPIFYKIFHKKLVHKASNLYRPEFLVNRLNLKNKLIIFKSMQETKIITLVRLVILISKMRYDIFSIKNESYLYFFTS